MSDEPEQPRRRKPPREKAAVPGDSRRRASMVALGRALAARRVEAGWSRQELAEIAGISYSHLAEIENGKKSASANTLGGIADALGVPVHRLWMSAESLAEEILRAPPAPARHREARAAMVGAAADQDEFAGYAFREQRLEPTTTPPPASRIGELLALASKLDEEDVQQLINLARRLQRRP